MPILLILALDVIVYNRTRKHANTRQRWNPSSGDSWLAANNTVQQEILIPRSRLNSNSALKNDGKDFINTATAIISASGVALAPGRRDR